MKLKDTLECILEILGNRKIVLARELTKIHEEFIRDTVSNILSQIEEVKGEFVILIDGNIESQKDVEKANLNDKTLEEHYDFYDRQGLCKKEIIKKIAKDRDVNKNEIYQYFINKK